MCQYCCSTRKFIREVYEFKVGICLCFWPCNPITLSHHLDGHLGLSSEPLCWSFLFLWIFLWLAPAPSHHWNLRSQCQLFREGFSDLFFKKSIPYPSLFYDITMFYDLKFSYLLIYACVYLCIHVCMYVLFPVPHPASMWRLWIATLYALYMWYSTSTCGLDEFLFFKPQINWNLHLYK